MTSNFNLPKTRGRPLGSKNKPAKKRAFKRSNTSIAKQKASKPLPIGAISWQDAYEKTYVNLDRACQRLVELQGVREELEQAKVDIIGLSTIINYLEIRLEEQYRKPNERTSV
jgi:hypothetical protein